VNISLRHRENIHLGVIEPTKDFKMPIDLISAELAENTFVAVGDKLDEKFGKKSWDKPLYWMTVIGLFSAIAVYYFW